MNDDVKINCRTTNTLGAILRSLRSEASLHYEIEYMVHITSNRSLGPLHTYKITLSRCTLKVLTHASAVLLSATDSAPYPPHNAEQRRQTSIESASIAVATSTTTMRISLDARSVATIIVMARGRL